MFWWFTGYPKLFLKNCQLEILYICSLKLKKNYWRLFFMEILSFLLGFLFFYLINGNVGFDETHMHTYFQSKKTYLTSTSTNTLCMDIATDINIWCMHYHGRWCYILAVRIISWPVVLYHGRWYHIMAVGIKWRTIKVRFRSTFTYQYSKNSFTSIQYFFLLWFISHLPVPVYHGWQYLSWSVFISSQQLCCKGGKLLFKNKSLIKRKILIKTLKWNKSHSYMSENVNIHYRLYFLKNCQFFNIFFQWI
jgi:hypothetical protein